MKKRLLCFLLLSVVCFSSCKPVETQQKENCIYGTEVQAVVGKEVDIPVSIKENNGFCGFEIQITYNADILTPVLVEGTKLLAEGTLNNSIATAQDNAFSVVWSGVEDIIQNGELFIVKFEVVGAQATTTELQLSYVKENTINEDIEEIAFACENIKINIVEG